MKNIDFYNALDEELTKIIASFSCDLNAQLKQEQQKKSYALMLWFLNTYSGITNVEEYITDGHDDNSCDMIFDKKNSQDETVFYLIQSKWNNEKNCSREFEADVLKSYLSDVNSVLRGDKLRGKNEKFNKRYEALLEHVKSNGEVKVLYLTLKNGCSKVNENIKSFETMFGGKVVVDTFDINRLKLDYIDLNYKKSCPPNPLEKVYNPEFEKITLSIVKDDERNFLKMNRPFDAHVFNILPKTIFQLVERYGVSLFDKNVRNPLVTSSINTEIVNSLKNNPSLFWYYNNGITAISRAIPSISSQADSFQVTGLQIINGAQTAYSIYLAYLESSPEERELIDSDARVTLRLLKSGGKEFDLKVTRFTNSQNPVSQRDFWSTDEIQTNIQNYFYGTNVWYERRSGEFRKKPKDIIKVPNNIVASAYLAFWLSNPVAVFEASLIRERDGTDLLFTSYKENKDGLYEVVFNRSTNPEDVYVAFCMFDILTDSKVFDMDNVFFSNGFHVLALSKVVLKKYIDDKYDSDANLSKYIIDSYQKQDFDLINRCFKFSTSFMRQEIEEVENEDEEKEKVINLMTKNSHFEMLLEKMNKVDITAAEIDAIELNSKFEDSLANLDDEDIEIIEDKVVH
ncbi:AIPR family protein [Pseudoalteromonas sp. BZP1]|uniref:AIPR family protein n=1 Tax=unclassified Pseudoalteromonas TaxID=194690 RepID=UPI0032C4983B